MMFSRRKCGLAVRRDSAMRAAALAAAAGAGVVGCAALDARAGESTIPETNTTSLRPVGQAAPTVSLSGSTAMRNFTISEGPTLLTPGTSITLGPVGQEVTYSAPAGEFTSFQFASGDFRQADDLEGDRQVHSGIRLEWHEQGSVEGVLELADSQIDDRILPNTVYQPTAGLATYVNRQKFGGASPGGPVPPATVNGFFLDEQGAGPRNPAAQSRVQMAISDVNARQGFSVGGARGAFHRTAGQAGYGKGNPYLLPGSLGTAGSRAQLQDQSVLNFSTDAIDPATGRNYAAGNPGETGGVNNLRNNTVAITATLFAANPGTGLERLNRTDAQFLQATGRLANGADFNVVTRDVNSGTLNVAASNVGLDPSFAVGENDSGNGNVADPLPQTRIGSDIRFSNKTAGGGQLRPTVQNARMAVGHLSMSDSIGSARAGAPRPLRGLDYRDDANDVADGSNAPFGHADAGSGQFVRASAATITSGEYVIYQNETFVTVRNPDGSYADNDPATELIKGDNSGNDVRDFRQNILGAVSNYPFRTLTSAANPADALVATSFILPQFMQVRKDQDGINQSAANPNYNAEARENFVNSPSAINFNPDAPAAVTTGNGSTYGNVAPAATGAIPITENNWLFGDFRQTEGGKGYRDFSDLAVAREAQQALHESGAGVDMFAGGANNTVVAGAPGRLGFEATKGDLIVLGDFNADGRFDGRDLYHMARGTALADSNSGETLTGDFADALRNGVLRKNAALDLLQATAAPQQKLEATASAANDPTGKNAFNKFDVNRDGRVNRQDAGVVDSFVGRDYRKLEDQLGAVVATNVNPAGMRFVGDPAADQTTPRRGISLVDVELNDDAVITHAAPGPGGASDFKLVRQALGPALLDGDADFDGSVGARDVVAVRRSLYAQNTRWSQGDFDFNGRTNFADYLAMRRNYGRTAPTDEAPDPATPGGGQRVRVLAAASVTGQGPNAGPGVSPAGGAELVVNLDTGEVKIVGDGVAGLTGYEIASDAGSLLPGNWQSLAGNGEAGWETLGTLTAALSEVNLDGAAAGGAAAGGGGGTLDLGSIFNTRSGARDLTFTYADASLALRAGRVWFVPEPGAGAVVLGAAGAALLGRRRRRRRLERAGGPGGGAG